MRERAIAQGVQTRLLLLDTIWTLYGPRDEQESLTSVLHIRNVKLPGFCVIAHSQSE